MRGKNEKSAIGDIEQKKRQRRALFTGGLAHIIHDGFTDMLYVFFPIWQVAFGLSFTEVGLLKTLFSGTMALFQVPAGIISNRLGEVRMLIFGTILTSTAVIFLGYGKTSILLGCLLVIGGLGSSVQHPLSSSIITGNYQDSTKRRIALSTFNVSGDIGKLLLPGAAAFLITQTDLATASRILGASGLFGAIIVYFASRNLFSPKFNYKEKESLQKGTHFIGWKGKRPFWNLSAIGVLDSATRMGFLTFFPFLIQEKGGDIALVGIALTSVFAGGAIGKFACGFLATRLGTLRTVIITEVTTALCIWGISILPLQSALLLAPILGIALNGTSSVLYGSVPELVSEEEQKQAFSIFYTATIGSGAIAPSLYGFISDRIGIASTVIVISMVVLLTIPLIIPLRRKLG